MVHSVCTLYHFSFGENIYSKLLLLVVLVTKSCVVPTFLVKGIFFFKKNNFNALVYLKIFIFGEVFALILKLILYTYTYYIYYIHIHIIYIIYIYIYTYYIV